MADSVDVDLNEMIDVRFSEIEAELFAIAEHREAIERQLPAIIKTELRRKERVAKNYPDEFNFLRVTEDFLNEVLPRIYRSSMLVQLWAVFEGAIIEIAKHLKEKTGHSLDIDDVRGGSDYERALTYYEKVLSRTPGNRRNLSPESAFLSLMKDDLDLHASIIERITSGQ